MAMVKLIDLTGQTFGLLTVLAREGSDSTGKTTWRSQCACGGISISTGLNLKKGVTKSCGCLKHRKGNANPKYKPIPLDVRRERKRAGAQYKHWRKSVLMRCPICIRCGADSNLHVHHLKGSHEYPESRFDPLNGVTLCAGCHTKFHVTFGRRKGFTEMDAEKFINAPIGWLVTRHSAKNGVADLKKAIHYLELLIELEGNK
jgi:5-methylcytosine-specific restriction endonuclease McrA